jgi:DNA-binding IscR family transcriptional regulator
MYDIFAAVGEGADIASCIFTGEGQTMDCHRKDKCPVHPTWIKLSGEIATILNGYTIKTIMDDTALSPTSQGL